MSKKLEIFWADLTERKLITNQANLANFIQLKPKKKVVYWGIDCTNDSLHFGHLFLMIQIVRFAQQGFQVILLLGGATSRIGDPSDKLKERPQLSKEKLKAYSQAIQEQIQQLLLTPKNLPQLNFGPLELFYHEKPEMLKKIYQILQLKKQNTWKRYLQYIWPLAKSGSFLILNNSQWLNQLSFLDFLQQVGQKISVNYLLAKETIKQRLDSPSGLSFLAFNYSLLQAYDFYYLYQNYHCQGQLGGSDQWGNLTTGLKLVRSFCPQNQTFALTFPLLTDSEGKKISKSAGSKAIWLALSKTSLAELYDFGRNMTDQQALKWLFQLTFLSKEQVEKINQLNQPRKLRIPQRILTELLFYFLHQEKGLIWLKENKK